MTMLMVQPTLAKHSALGHVRKRGRQKRQAGVAGVKITNEIELRAWLKDKPREWAVAIAARAALRVVPGWPIFLELAAEDFRADFAVLALFRCVAISWLSALLPNRNLIRPARAAADFAVARAIPYSRHIAAYSAHSAAISAADPATDTAAISAAFSAGTFAIYSSDTATAWAAVTTDAAALEKGLPTSMTGHLWRSWSGGDGTPAAIHSVDPPDWATRDWAALKQHLGTADNWQVWTEWYEAILDGKPAWSLSHDIGNEIMFTALTWPEEEWEKGPAYVNRRIASLIEAARAKAAVYDGRVGELQASVFDIQSILSMQSPDVVQRPDGVIDLSVNPTYDIPTPIRDFHELPAQQISLIDALVEGLPGNAPKLLRASLLGYRKHLEIRPKNPFLGTLNQHEEIVRAEFKSTDAKEWCSTAQNTAYRSFKKTHALIRKNFPLEPKREAVIAAVPVDESKLDSPTIRKAFSAMVDAARNAEQIGVITSEVMGQIKDDAELSKTLTGLVIAPGDRPAPPGVSPAKRFILNKFGFYKRLAEVSAVGSDGVTIVKDGAEAFQKLAATAQWLWQQLRALLPL
jgi:hypothetical protein